METRTNAKDFNLCILYHAYPSPQACLPVSPNCTNVKITELLQLNSKDWPKTLQHEVFLDCRLIAVPLAHGIEPNEPSKRVLSLIIGVIKRTPFLQVADFTLCRKNTGIARSSVTLIRERVCLTVLNSLPSDKPLLLHTVFENAFLKSILFPVLTKIGKNHLQDISKSKGRFETEKARAVELLKNLTRLGSDSFSAGIGDLPIQLGFSCRQEWEALNDSCSQTSSLEKMLASTCSVGLMSVEIRNNPWQQTTQPWSPIV